MERSIRCRAWRHRFCRVIMVGLFLCLSFAQTGGASAETAAEILRRVDESRALRPQFAFEMALTAYQSGEEIDRYTLAGYVRIEAEKAQTLLYFLDPPKVNGQKMLMRGDEIWMHFPKTKNVIKLSPIQILLGEVANGDLLQIGFSSAYQCRFLSDGEAADHWCLLLEARENEGANYQKIILWVDKETALPVTGEFYARSGKLLKRVLYQDYQIVLGKLFAMKVTIHDGTQPDRYTVMQYMRLVEKSLPVNYYRKEYLPRFTYVPLN
jgi:negative regulator of sigma E activity